MFLLFKCSEKEKKKERSRSIKPILKLVEQHHKCLQNVGQLFLLKCCNGIVVPGEAECCGNVEKLEYKEGE